MHGLDRYSVEKKKNISEGFHGRRIRSPNPLMHFDMCKTIPDNFASVDLPTVRELIIKSLKRSNP